MNSRDHTSLVTKEWAPGYYYQQVMSKTHMTSHSAFLVSLTHQHGSDIHTNHLNTGLAADPTVHQQLDLYNNAIVLTHQMKQFSSENRSHH